MSVYSINIEKDTFKNNNYRKVINNRQSKIHIFYNYKTFQYLFKEMIYKKV